MIIEVIEDRETLISKVDFCKSYYSGSYDERVILFGCDGDNDWSESYKPSDVESCSVGEFKVAVYQSGKEIKSYIIDEDTVKINKNILGA